MPPDISRHTFSRRCLGGVVLAGSLLLGGCGLVPVAPPGPPPDLTLFLEGVDSLETTSSPAAFSRLAAEFPGSPWTEKAKVIEHALNRAREDRRERSNLQGKLEECQAEKETLAGNIRTQEDIQKKLNGCREEKERLAGDLRSLEKYTNRLKSLLTEAGIAEPVPPSR